MPKRGDTKHKQYVDRIRCKQMLQDNKSPSKIMKELKRSRKFAIVVILIVAAVITPSPDWISQLIVFTPLFMLYQLSILVSKRAYKTMQEDDENWDKKEEEEVPEEWS